MYPRVQMGVSTSKCSAVLAVPLTAQKAEHSGHIFIKKFRATVLSHVMLKKQPACMLQESCDVTAQNERDLFGIFIVLSKKSCLVTHEG